ncbi:MAG: response regulator transcription factor [Bacteroidota bacterium]
MNQRPIYIAIVEDDPEIRQLLTLILNGSPGFSCSHSYPDAESALAGLTHEPPDVVLMDIQLPGMSGIECTQQLRELHPKLDIIMLTVQEENDDIFDSLCAGATGYLVKETPPTKLLAAIEEAKAGGSPMSPRIARRVIGSFHQSPVKSPLSARETEVLGLLCEGRNYRQIADQLFVSTNTVKAHIKHIYEKLHVHNRAEAVRKAMQDKLV